MDNTFSAYIMSNGSKDFYPENTLSKFSVKFPFSLNLPTNTNEKWGIAVNSIGLSSKFESKYSNYSFHPLIIQMVNLHDNIICQDSSAQGYAQAVCENVILNYNKHIYKYMNQCYIGNEEYKTCNIKEIKDQLINWAFDNLFYGFDFTNKNPNFDSIHLTNFYFNNLEVENDLTSLLSHLSNSELNVTKSGNNKFTIKSKRTNERLFFLRNDLVERCNISQDTSFINLNTYKKILPMAFMLFRNLTNARDLNNSFLRIGSHNYKMFVLNEEFLSLNIEFKKYMKGFLAIPNLIKIKCDNIRNQVFNNTHSNDIELIRPNFDNEGSHYFHEFEKPVFIPLLNSNLDNLTFHLTDEYNEQLTLSTGLPTILSITLKKMSSEFKSFNIRLTPTFDVINNTSSKFKTILPNTFSFNKNWSFGLKDITFPNHFKILPSEENEVVVIKLNNDMKMIQTEKHKIPIPNLRTNLNDLINYLNDKVLAIDAFKFEYDNDTKFISIKTRTNINVYISKHLAQILGFISLTASENDTSYWKGINLKSKTIKKAEYPANIKIFRPAFLMIYMDFVELTLVSGVYTNILKIVPVKIESEELECQTKEFKTIEYRRLNKTVLSEINTEIRDPSGKLVQFDNNKLSLHLYFTNSPYNEI